jgi:2-oxoglutarate/2-oxoacid ferredoxin oxidoreductase subunit alpha
MKVDNLIWKVVGEAGSGIMSVGLVFSKIFAKRGYHVIDGNEYPSLIRGGKNTYTVRISTKKIYSLSHEINILVVLNKEMVKVHQEELSYGGYIIYDGDGDEVYEEEFKGRRKDINYINVPFKKIISQIEAPDVMINNVSLGASLALINMEIDALNTLISDMFKHKGQKVIELNTKAAELGYWYIREKLNISPYELESIEPIARVLLTGNDAIFLGALRAGCKFYAAYPMTPASSILHSFASIEDEYNVVTKHAEDEIAVINMVIGASFAGIRAMAATSGGGFSLMNEAIGSAAITETPLVLVVSQRPAPATGLPTWTEQGDMMFATHCSHGEFLRVIMAPGDAEECFYMTGAAFNLAEKFQVPVIILLDKYLSESHFSYERLNFKKIEVDRGLLYTRNDVIPPDFKRYEFKDSGISPRTVCGLEGAEHIANSDEHDEYGMSEEDSSNRKNMVDKRFKKVNKLIEEIPRPSFYGPEEAEVTIWSWGSCKGPILEAMKALNIQEKKVNFIHFSFLYPFALDYVNEFIKKTNKNVIVENNKTSQLAKIIMLNTGLRIKNKILKYNGRQFDPEDIVTALQEI